MIDVTKEIRFQTARSGGKGGQNVNKVETMVEGYFNVAGSNLLTPEQKARIQTRLQNKLTSDGILQVKSQVHRTQLANKNEVVSKLNDMIGKALVREKKRVPTKPSRNAKEKRFEEKKKGSEIKENRQKLRTTDFR
jgi:ribosome-associated protein